jgi:V8-like Glu-specific endopeptidase
MRKVFCKLLALIFVCSCGKDSGQDGIYDEGTAAVKEKKNADLERQTSLELDWKNLNWGVESEQTIAYSVVYINKEDSDQNHCTGFVVSKNLILTSNNCISSEDQLIEAQFYVARSTTQKTSFQCDYIKSQSFQYNYSFIYCDEMDYLSLEALTLNRFHQDNSVQGNLYQYNCHYLADTGCEKKLKVSSNPIEFVEGELFYEHSSLPYSTGAPLISNGDQTVIGIHQSTEIIDSTFPSILNTGQSMSEILDYLKVASPNTYEKLKIN